MKYLATTITSGTSTELGYVACGLRMAQQSKCGFPPCGSMVSRISLGEIEGEYGKYPRWIRLNGASDAALLKAVGKSIQQQRTAAGMQCANRRGHRVIQFDPVSSPKCRATRLISPAL